MDWNDHINYRRGDDDFIEIEGTIIHETEKAWLISVDDDEAWEVWLPKSQVTDNDDGSFSVPRWLAREKGLC